MWSAKFGRKFVVYSCFHQYSRQQLFPLINCGRMARTLHLRSMYLYCSYHSPLSGWGYALLMCYIPSLVRIKLIAGIRASLLLPWKRDEGWRTNWEMMVNQTRINGDPVPPFIFSHQIQRRLRKHPIQFLILHATTLSLACEETLRSERNVRKLNGGDLCG
jgi:hypothetical protein